MNREELKSCLVAAVLALLLVTPLVCVCGCPEAKADYVLSAHLPADQCPPCRAMEPIEDALIARGYDIRRIDATKYEELIRYYHITRFPQYVYVRTTARGDFDSGAPHLVGMQSAGTLARYCYVPATVGTVGIARNAVRAIFSPIPAVVP